MQWSAPPAATAVDKVAGPAPTSEGEAQARSGPLDRLAVDFALLFEHSSEVLLVLLPDAPRFTMVAATDARFVATHTSRESLGQGLFEVFPDNPDDPAASGTNNLRASLERVLKTRQADTMPVQKYDIRGLDGGFESKYWSPKNLPILSANGEVLYILHRVEDVTELVRASEIGAEMRGRTHAMEREVISRSHELEVALRQLREMNGKLAELDAAKTAFFSNISHEFRTPLTLILGTLEDELANGARLPPGTQLQLRAAHRNSLRLLKLVNSLLDFSRIEAGRMQAQYHPTNLALLTAELADTFRSAIERGGLSLTIDCPPLPELIYVDHEMWEKIVLNLLSNAFKHTFKGGIVVRLAWHEGTATLSVEDTGVGIAATDIARLFDRFQRVAGAASRTHDGTGIGLALVKELVQLHAGQIRVESTLGRGSRFCVTVKSGTAHLPADKIDAISDVPAAGSSATPFIEEALSWSASAPDGTGASGLSVVGSAALPETSKWRTPRARVLLADDNEDMRSYVSRLLSRSYDVTAVADGQAALASAFASPPDLILSDVMMPRLDGFGLLRALRADERTRRLPIILLSARAGEEAAVAGLDTGADDYLIKPFSARELMARVRTHVELAWQRRSWEIELEKRVKERTAELETQIKRMGLLDVITRATSEGQDLRRIFQVVVRSVEASLPADICWIGFPGSDVGGLDLENEVRYEPDVNAESIRLPAELSGLALRAWVATPLRAQGVPLGLLITGRREVDSFTPGESEFLRQLAQRLAIAIRQGQLHESLQAAYDDLHLTQTDVLRLQLKSAPAPAQSAQSAVEPPAAEPKISSR
jgi:signal transduction histidine kinase/DNA-binding response OmpR family regulator